MTSHARETEKKDFHLTSLKITFRRQSNREWNKTPGYYRDNFHPPVLLKMRFFWKKYPPICHLLHSCFFFIFKNLVFFSIKSNFLHWKLLFSDVFKTPYSFICKLHQTCYDLITKNFIIKIKQIQWKPS